MWKVFHKKRLTNHNEQENQLFESDVLENVSKNNKIILPEKRNNENMPNVSAYENHRSFVNW